MNAEILSALRSALKKLPEDEKAKKVTILGLERPNVFTIEELVEEYAKDTPAGKQFEKTLIFNTVMRLAGKT